MNMWKRREYFQKGRKTLEIWVSQPIQLPVGFSGVALMSEFRGESKSWRKTPFFLRQVRVDTILHFSNRFLFEEAYNTEQKSNKEVATLENNSALKVVWHFFSFFQLLWLFSAWWIAPKRLYKKKAKAKAEEKAMNKKLDARIFFCKILPGSMVNLSWQK